MQGDDFDVHMEAYDPAKVADLLGLYILEILSRIIDTKHIGLYRDNGLVYILNRNRPL